MNAHAWRLATAALLRLAAVVVLALAVAGRPWPVPRSTLQVAVLADRSTSIDSDALEAAHAAVLAELRRGSPSVELREFEITGRSTDLQSALITALSPAGPSVPTAIVVLSDGHATQGDTRSALEAAAAAGTTVLWHTVSPDVNRPRIVGVHGPAAAGPQQAIPVTVQLGGVATGRVHVTVAARDRPASAAGTSLDAGPLGIATINLQAAAPGTLLLDVTLGDAATGAMLDERTAALAIEVRPPAQLLYVARGTTPLAAGLRAGGWPLQQVEPEAFDSLADSFDRYACIVLDDVAVDSARAATWQALARSVNDQGTGLLVLGGGQSFAAGGYHDSTLEALLPVLSRPGALGERATVSFVVDKSGSMGASAAGVDRFRLAQRAVIETAATLANRDAAELIVFDVEARQIVPLQAAEQFRRSVASPWPARPRGGTRLAPALDLAVARLEASPPGRRFLVLVTDGFAADAADAALRTRIEHGGIELIALAVGVDADLATLERLVVADRGTVLRVAEAAELPSLMRSSLEVRRARIERGRLAVRARTPLPFPLDGATDWPPVAAYAVTSARPQATVHLESARGDPLLASWQAGLGRVTALTSGVGAWTPEWLRWSQWPSLSGGLVAWVGREDAPQAFSVRVVDQPSSLRVDVDSAADGLWSAGEAGEVRFRAGAAAERRLPLIPSAPGRMSATVAEPAPGLHALTIVTPWGTQRVSHLRHAVPEIGPLEPNAEITAWRDAGLLQEWSAVDLRRALTAAPSAPQLPVAALVLALLLFLLGVMVERGR